MHYQGRAVEIYGWMTKGQSVPLLYPGDKGEKMGDFAVIDGHTVVWDGKNWMPAPDVWKIAPKAS
jgi:hypothetical protein